MSEKSYTGGCQCGAKMAAINVNCLDDVDPRSLTPHHVDGKDH
ncbi:hypothetical protein [Thalassospira sp. A3_1]|nr:hypothetical protein [Thalassospira sp. A3_1]